MQRTYLLWREAARHSAAARQPLQYAHRALLADLCHACESSADNRGEDGVPETIDICPGIFDPSQADFDQDGLPDVCDPDDDNDGDPDGVDPDPFNAAVNSASLRQERSESATFVNRGTNAPFAIRATVGELIDLLA